MPKKTMIDIVEIRWAIFEKTRTHRLSCMIHGFNGRNWREQFAVCSCDEDYKKQYLQDLIVQRPEGDK